MQQIPGRCEWREGVTFRQFRWLAVRYGWTAEQLVERVGAGAFGGPRSSPYYETPAVYLARVLRKGHAIDDETVIPYSCLIRLYVNETTPRAVGRDGIRRCRCGCGTPVFGRQRYAAVSCRMRAYRERGESEVRDPQNPAEKL
jgi:hypothetical protein